MKRLAWLLLAVFGAALLQVQPAEGLPAKAKCCDCCHVPGTAEMPGCCAPAAALPTALGSEQSARVSSPAIRRAAPVGGAAELAYVSFVEPEAIRSALPAPAEAARAAGVPLFKAHCSFLI
jgi:hypothetical protein